MELRLPNSDEPVGAKRKSRFIGEPKMINHENTKFIKHEMRNSKQIQNANFQNNNTLVAQQLIGPESPLP